MKEKFLKELKEALANASVENLESVLEIYSSRFDLGYEAGMSDEEIIDMLGSIEEIVAMYSKPDKSEKGFNVVLELAYFSDFKIVESDNSGIEFVLDNKAYDYVTVEKEGNEIALKSKNKTFTHRHLKSFDGVMKIGKDVLINNLNINSINCDFSSISLKAKNAVISNISGDLDFERLEVEDRVQITNTSGDIRLELVSAPKVIINTISGDIDIDKLTGNDAKISVVSGDVKISESNNTVYKANSISGEITIRGDVSTDRVNFTSVSGSCVVNGVKIGKDLSTTLKEAFSKMKF